MFNDSNLESLAKKLELIIKYPLLAKLILPDDTVAPDLEGVTAISTAMGVVYISETTVKVDFDAGTHADSIRGVARNSPAFYAMVALESARLSAIVTIINNSRPATPIPEIVPTPPKDPATSAILN